ncbi:CHC2 zinc finger domain-containing protein [Streptomyces sp. NPDC051561]|uniref:CHC2 zinc finger domain-containing protein n=1 Tax=Streptomyces sp. NPDC051561 TaxID=3365658 RepID=UPI0037BC27B4
MGRMSKPPIAAVLRHYYGLRVEERAGHQKVSCPLHDDSSPSASVNTVACRWSCFVCRLSEDSYAVIMREESCGFTDAQEFARSRRWGRGEDVSPDDAGKPGGGVRGGSGPRSRSRVGRTGLRPFGASWS